MESILFLCTGNSCRSQMAEAWGHKLLGDRFKVYSAGIEAHGLNPRAVKVMAEVGIDIRGQKSQTVDQVPWSEMDMIVSVCGHADASCPQLPSHGKKVHQPFDDPPKLAANSASEEEALRHFRRVRDEIRSYVESLA